MTRSGIEAEPPYPDRLLVLALHAPANFGAVLFPVTCDGFAEGDIVKFAESGKEMLAGERTRILLIPVEHCARVADTRAVESYRWLIYGTSWATAK